MSGYQSFVVQHWQSGEDGTMRWRVHCVRGDQELSFPDASFLIRTWTDDAGQVVRGVIRHVQSGREMQFQSGARALEFVRAWLDVDEGEPIECDLSPLGEDAALPTTERQ